MYSFSEAIQLLVLGACFALALVRALRARNSAWTEVACFYACMFLGNVYWYGYLAVFGDTPNVSYISDLSWIAGYIFLLMLLVECDQARGLAAPVPAAWVPVAVCAVCCVYYIYVNGYPLLNLVDNGLMAALGFFAVRGLAARRDEPLRGGSSSKEARLQCHPERGEGSSRSGFACNRFLHGVVLAFVIVEQVLWLSSLHDPTADLTVYGIANYLLTFSYAAILAAAWRSGEL